MSETQNNSGFQLFLDKLAVGGQKLASQKQLSIIRDGFGSTIPLIMAGAIALLIGSLFLSPTGVLAGQIFGIEKGSDIYNGWNSMYTYVNPYFAGIQDAALNYTSLYVTFIWGMLTAKAYGHKSPMLGGVIGLAAFLCISPVAAGGDTVKYLGAQGLLGAMITSLTIPILFTKLCEVRHFRINMPNGVPQAVGDAFAVIIPAAISLFAATSIQATWHLIADVSGLIDKDAGYAYFMSAIETAISKPLESLGNTPYAVFLVAFLISLLWMFGLHGTNVLAPILVIVWMAPMVENMVLYSTYVNTISPITGMSFGQYWDVLDNLNAAEGNFGDILGGAGITLPPAAEATLSGLSFPTFSPWTLVSFNVYGKIGGDGLVFGLVIALLLFSKVPASKSIARISSVPGAFNVSEPMVFGLPLMLNPTYFIPFVLAAPIVNTVAFELTTMHWFNPVIMLVPTQTPTFLLQYLFTVDWRPVLYVFITLPFGILCYLPFVFVENQQYIKNSANERGIETSEFLVINDIELKVQKAESKIFKPVEKVEFEMEKIEKKIGVLTAKLAKLEPKLEKAADDKKTAISEKISNINAEIKAFKNELASKQKELVSLNTVAEKELASETKNIETEVKEKHAAKAK